MGYVKACCSGCLFYKAWSDGGCHGQICSLRNLTNNWRDNERLEWISATDCDNSTRLKIEYYKKCPYRTDFNDVCNQYRKELGIIK